MDAKTWIFIICSCIAGIALLAGLLYIVTASSSRFTAQQIGTKYDPDVIAAEAKKTPPNPPTPPPTSLE